MVEDRKGNGGRQKRKLQWIEKEMAADRKGNGCGQKKIHRLF